MTPELINPIVNEHHLIHAKDAGNGYHGYCQHCGLILETYLGGSSWDNTKCIDREILQIKGWLNLPNIVREFIEFRGFQYDKLEHKFYKPFSIPTEEYTVEDIWRMIYEIKNTN